MTFTFASVDVGVSTTLNSILGGGTGPFSWSYTGTPPGPTSVYTGTYTVSPDLAGNYSVTLTVTDAFGRIAIGVADLVVNALPTVLFTVSQTKATLGDTVTFIATESGGTGAIRFSYSGLPPGCAKAIVDTFACLPTAAGTYHVTVNVTDAFGKNASAVVVLVVNEPTTPIFGLSSVQLTIGLAVLLVLAIVVFVALRRRPNKPTIVATPAAPPRPKVPRPESRTPVPEWVEEPSPPKEWQEGP